MVGSELDTFGLLGKHNEAGSRASLVPLSDTSLVEFRTNIEGAPHVIYIPRSSLPELRRRLEERIRSETKKANLAEKLADRTFNLSLAVAGIFAAAGFGFLTAYGLTFGGVALFISSVIILGIGVRLSTEVDRIASDHQQKMQYAEQRLEGVKS